MRNRFRSAIDWWYWAVMGFGALVTVFACIQAWPQAGTIGRVVLLLAAMGMVAFPCWLALATWYQIEEEQLIIRSGPFRWVVPRDQIEAIEPTRLLWSSPALSLDRLKIQYGKRAILVSPRDKAGFTAALGLS